MYGSIWVNGKRVAGGQFALTLVFWLGRRWLLGSDRGFDWGFSRFKFFFELKGDVSNLLLIQLGARDITHVVLSGRRRLYWWSAGCALRVCGRWYLVGCE